MLDGFNIVLGWSHVAVLLGGLIVGFCVGRIGRRKEHTP